MEEQTPNAGREPITLRADLYEKLKLITTHAGAIGMEGFGIDEQVDTAVQAYAAGFDKIIAEDT